MSVSNASDFIPIQRLYHSDADVALVFLTSSGVAYKTEVDDLWYSAHQLMPGGSNVGGSKFPEPFYLADEPAGVLGCTMQNQICNPNLSNTGRCTPLSSLFTLNKDTILSLWQDDTKIHEMSWPATIMAYATLLSPDEVIRKSGVSALISRDHLSNGVMFRLPANQWQLDVETWFRATLSSLQATFVDAANGPGKTGIASLTIRPNSTSQCRNQVSKIFIQSLIYLLTTTYNNAENN